MRSFFYLGLRGGSNSIEDVAVAVGVIMTKSLSYFETGKISRHSNIQSPNVEIRPKFHIFVRVFPDFLAILADLINASKCKHPYPNNPFQH